MRPRFPVVGGWTLSARPVLSTTPPALHPDLGPGAGQERDRALDAEAQGPVAAPVADDVTEGEARAAVDVDESLRRATLALATKQREERLRALGYDGVSEDQRAENMANNLLGIDPTLF